MILSSLTALILVAGSIYNLANETAVHFPSDFPGVKVLGSTLLLLFWAIIGWEVIGNYVEEVQNPKRTIMRAMKISIAVVVLVYLLSTFTLQNSLDQQLMRTTNASHMNLILVPLFGGFSSWIIGLIATGLCFCTLIMILGAVTRQIAARAEAGSIPAFFKQKKEEKSPKRALLMLSLFHCLMITLVHFELITIEWLVGIANTFFYLQRTAWSDRRVSMHQWFLSEESHGNSNPLPVYAAVFFTLCRMDFIPACYFFQRIQKLPSHILQQEELS